MLNSCAITDIRCFHGTGTDDARIKIGDLPVPEIKLGKKNLMCVHAGDLKYGMVTFIDANTAGPILQDLQEKIDAYVEKCKDTYKPEVVEVVIAKFEDMWYRGVVLEENANDYSIFFIDYGNTDVIPKSDIKKLPSAIKKIPPASFICILDGVVKEDNEEVADALFSKLNGLILENETYVVDILEYSNNSSRIKIPSVYEKVADLL